MSKVPTVEEFLKSKGIIGERGELRKDQLAWLCKEFAKLHVKAALKAAANEYYSKDKKNFELVANRFLNSYPDENIK